MTPGPGWYKDPYFLQHERYWDNGWTDYVRRVDAKQLVLGASAAPPAISPEADAHKVGAPRAAETVAAGTAVPASEGEHHAATPPISTPTPGRGEAATGENPVVHADDTLAVAPVRRDDDTWVVSAVPRDDDTATVPAVPAVSAEPDTQSLPLIAGSNGGPSHGNGGPPAAQSTGTVPVVPRRDSWESGAPSADEEAAVRARARRRRLGFVAAALLVVVIAVVAVVATRGSPSNGGAGGGSAGGGVALAAGSHSVAAAATPTAAQAVTTIAAASVHKDSVVVSVALVPAGSTQSTTQQISGSGDFILDSALGTFSATVPGATTKDQKFVFQGRVLYFSVTHSPVAGKSWVVASTNNLPALGYGSKLSSFMEEMGNPALLLQQLTGPSVTEASLGTSTVGGTTVRRYDANFSSSVTALSAAGFSSSTSEEVDVGADGLVQQIVIPVSVYGQGVQTDDIVVAFSHYGKPVSVVTPQFAQLISLSQYLTGPVPG